MSLSQHELESKAQMLVNPPDPNDPYVLPPDIVGIPRARIEGRADVMRNQNAAIARFNRVPAVAPAPATPAPATQEPSTSGGKRRKSKRSKRRKSKRKRKSRR